MEVEGILVKVEGRGTEPEGKVPKLKGKPGNNIYKRLLVECLFRNLFPCPIIMINSLVMELICFEKADC